MLVAGQLARQVYECMRREASSLMIQRDLRMYLARKAYKELHSSAVSIQTGMRGMAVRIELRFRRQTRAAIIIQVNELSNQMHFAGFKRFLVLFLLFNCCLLLFLKCRILSRAINIILVTLNTSQGAFDSIIMPFSLLLWLAESTFNFIYYILLENTFVTVLQSQCRKYLARLHYMQIKKAAITTQCEWRARVARQELRKLKMVTTSFLLPFVLFHHILCYDSV